MLDSFVGGDVNQPQGDVITGNNGVVVTGGIEIRIGDGEAAAVFAAELQERADRAARRSERTIAGLAHALRRLNDRIATLTAQRDEWRDRFLAERAALRDATEALAALQGTAQRVQEVKSRRSHAEGLLEEAHLQHARAEFLREKAAGRGEGGAGRSSTGGADSVRPTVPGEGREADAFVLVEADARPREVWSETDDLQDEPAMMRAAEEDLATGRRELRQLALDIARMDERPSAAGGDRERPLRIGVFGAARCGKSAFLAAMSIAAARSGGTWTVVGTDDASAGFLTEGAYRLAVEKTFRVPAPPRELACELRHRGAQGRDTWVRIELVEISGEDPSAAEIGRLAACDGLVYLVDFLEEKGSDAYGFLQRVLMRLELEASREPGAVLPQSLSVCVSKADDVRILAHAERLGLLAADERARPTVTAAEELFEAMCDAGFIPNSDLIPGLVRGHFARSATAYFFTSATGFYRAEGSSAVSRDDLQNVIPDESGAWRIRGRIDPVNVLEPLVWHTSIGRRRRSRRWFSRTR